MMLKMRIFLSVQESLPNMFARGKKIYSRRQKERATEEGTYHELHPASNGRRRIDLAAFRIISRKAEEGRTDRDGVCDPFSGNSL